MRGPRLDGVLLGLAGLTLAATLAKALGLAAPAPQRTVPATLAVAGYQVAQTSGGRTARQGRDLSQGQLTMWRLNPTGGGPPLTLSLLPVRSRNVGYQSGLEMAAIAQLAGSFTLRDRRLIGADQPETSPVPTLQLALGRGPGDGAGTTSRLQTCLTPDGRAGVTGITLGRQLGEERNTARQSLPLRTRLLQLTGLEANTRWECLAVQLQTRPGPDAEARLLAAWAALKPALDPPLSPAAGDSAKR